MKNSWWSFGWFVRTTMSSCCVFTIIAISLFYYCFFCYYFVYFLCSFLRLTSSENIPVMNDSEELQLVEEKTLTKEEWHEINKLLSYQPEEESTLLSGKDMQHMIQYLVNVSIGHAAARIIGISQTEIICGRFEQLQFTTKLYHRSVHCDISLRFCGFSALEGSLAEVFFCCNLN